MGIYRVPLRVSS
jgi:nucleotide-binding universal stress UspA family protein